MCEESHRSDLSKDKIEWGMAGEQNIDFELKNSHMPMYVIHDLYLLSTLFIFCTLS